MNDGALFAFAGLWDRWKDIRGTWLTTCSILTTAPNALTSAVRDRMPVILDPEGYDLWLDPGMRNMDAVCELLKPYDARQMRSYPVSNRINQVANDDEGCSRPVETVEEQPCCLRDSSRLWGLPASRRKGNAFSGKGHPSPFSPRKHLLACPPSKNPKNSVGILVGIPGIRPTLSWNQFDSLTREIPGRCSLTTLA